MEVEKLSLADIRKLSPDDLIIRIAQCLSEEVEQDEDTGKWFYYINSVNEPHKWSLKPVPNWTTDLDEIHRLEIRIPDKLKVLYANAIIEFVNAGRPVITRLAPWYIAHATAIDKARAMLFVMQMHAFQLTVDDDLLNTANHHHHQQQLIKGVTNA